MKLNTKSLAGVEIGIPQISEGIYHARIVGDKLEVKPNKRGDGNNLYLQIRILDNPVTLYKDGSEIENKGQIVCSRYISLTPTPDYDPDQNLKELAIAIRLAPEADLNVDDLRDKLVMVKVEHKDEEKDKVTGKVYPAGNEIRRFTPVPDDDTFMPPPFG